MNPINNMDAHGRRRQKSRTPPVDFRELRIVLVGKTGSGKSASANTILGEDFFKVELSPQSVTETCSEGSGKVYGIRLKVVDTPGLFGTDMAADALKRQIEKCVDLSFPGPHAFLLVVRLGVRFTEEEKNAVMWIRENFGEGALNYTIVLFSYGDILKGKPLDPLLKTSPNIQSLIDSCGGRYHTLNNKEKNDQSQVNSLLQKIQDMVRVNRGEYYTNKMYQEVQEKLREQVREEREKRKIAEEKVEVERARVESERKRTKEAERKAKEERKKKEEADSKASAEKNKRIFLKRKAEEQMDNVAKKVKVEVSGLRSVAWWSGVVGASFVFGGLVAAGAAGAAVAGAAAAGIGAAALGGAAWLGKKADEVDKDITEFTVKKDWE